MEASQQGQINQIEAELATVSQDLTASSQKLQAEIDALAAGNPALDLSGLQSVADQLDPAAQAIGNLVPSQPAPPNPNPPAPPAP